MLEDILATGYDASRCTFKVGSGSSVVTEEMLRAALHHRGELQIGPRIKLWCVCGFRWEGEGRREAEEAWNGHLD